MVELDLNLDLRMLKFWLFLLFFLVFYKCLFVSRDSFGLQVQIKLVIYKYWEVLGNIKKRVKERLLGKFIEVKVREVGGQLGYSGLGIKGGKMFQ